MECEDACAAWTPDEKIHVNRGDSGVIRKKRQVVFVGAVHVAAGLNLVLVLLGKRLALPYHAGALEISAFCGEDAVVHIALDGAFVAREFWCVSDADVMDRLSGLDFW